MLMGERGVNVDVGSIKSLVWIGIGIGRSAWLGGMGVEGLSGVCYLAYGFLDMSKVARAPNPAPWC